VLLGVFRDPLRCFLLVAVIVGGTFVWLVPPFAGIDEPAHFFRSYQMTTGRFFPADSPDEQGEFHGACIPDDLIREVDAHVAKNLRAIGFPAQMGSLNRFTRCGEGEHFYTYSTFGSPVPYLPQAATVGISRIFDPTAEAMDKVARITTLAVFLLLIALAIRRTPRQKWAFAGIGLLPLALFQAGTLTHDGLTIALALVLVSSALRIADPRMQITTRSALIEAGTLSLLLALCKPTYIVLGLLYLLPLVGSARRRELRLLAAVVGGAIAISVVWNAAFENLWRTDADLLGIKIDSDQQRHSLFTEPWRFVATTFRTVIHQIDDWIRGLLNVGDRVVDLWPLGLLLVVGVVFMLVSLQAERDESPAFDRAQRILIAVTFVLGFILIAVAQYIYYTGPNDDQLGGFAARYFVPILILLPLSVGTLRWTWARAREAVVPIAVVYAPFYVAFLVAVGDRMR
jgi:uncharacterized membrane protein